MKFKKIFVASLAFFLATPFFARADRFLDIKDIRGEKNYFYDLMINHDGLVIDESMLPENLYAGYKSNKGKSGGGNNSGNSGNSGNNANRSHNFANMPKSTSSSQGHASANDLTVDTVLGDIAGKTFEFSSGAGAWRTNLQFGDNGYFVAEYSDRDVDTRYINRFVGRFSVDSKVNDTCYILYLDEVETITPSGTSFVSRMYDTDVETIYSDLPYGFAVNNETDHSFQRKFTLYLPLRKRSEMSDAVNQWLNISGEPNVNDYETRIYLLVNNSTIDTFREVVGRDVYREEYE
jgi:hypothetical protein